MSDKYCSILMPCSISPIAASKPHGRQQWSKAAMETVLQNAVLCSIRIWPNLSSTKLHVLLALANNCEVQGGGCASQVMYESAASYRQHLFVAMIEQGVTVPTSCARCRKSVHAHQASQPTHGNNNCVFVTSCFHAVHGACMNPWGSKQQQCPLCQTAARIFPCI